MSSGKRRALRDIAIIYVYLCFTLALLCVAQQVVLALVGIVFRRRLPKVNSLPPKTRFIIFVPAYNEGVGILPTIDSLLKLDYPSHLFSVVVIADNCTDNSAEVATGAGAQVWVRNVPELRGKGHALAWAFARLNSLYDDAVVVIDADTEADPRLLARLSAAMESFPNNTCLAAYQVRYEFATNDQIPGWLQEIGIASKAAENSFVYRSREILGLTNLLQGNGFCLPLTVLKKVPWTAGSIVEDAEYAISLCLADIKIHYLDDVRVVSRIAKNESDSAPQKVRWSKGMMILIKRFVPKLITHAIRRRRIQFIEAALMLLLTSRLMTIYFLLAGLPAVVFVPLQSCMSVFIILAIAILLQSLFAVLLLCASSDDVYSLANLWLLPRYVTHLVAAHLRSLASFRTRDWTRTVR